MPDAGWTERWIGRPWVDGRYDCTDFVLEVLLEEFGLAPALPARAATTRGRDRQIRDLALEFARPIRTGEAPRDGDGVLMRQLGRRVDGHHIGLWAGPAAAGHVLHCMRGLGSALHPLPGLEQRGLEATGIYRWS